MDKKLYMDMGAAAYALGKLRAPGLDVHLAENMPLEHADRMAAIAAWLYGWDMNNMKIAS